MPSTKPKSNDQLPSPDAEKLELLQARFDELSEYVAEQEDREAFDVLTPQLEEGEVDVLDVLNKKF